jgi:putative ABC transport system permease protein
MIKNYLKTLWRNILKNKLHTAINIVGMAVAFTCSILLITMVYHEFSYDKFHENSDKLFEVYSFANSPQGLETGNSMSYPVASTLKSEGIGIDKATRIKFGGREVRYKDKELEQSTLLVDDDFFSMFSFKVVKGNSYNPLGSTGNVVLSEKTAGNLFGKEDPVGKPIEVKIGGKWNTLVVSAVLQDAPENSSLKYSTLARTELDPDYAEGKNNWNMQHHNVFVQLQPNATQADVEKQLRAVSKKYNITDVDYLKKKGYKPDANGELAGLRLLPLKDLHFNAKLNNGNGVSINFLYILLLVAAVIILIASFNFVNLNLGLSFTRTREMGIRKCLGAGKKQVWFQVWGESLITVLVSMFIGIFVSLVLMQGLNKFFDAQLDKTLLYQPVIIFSLVMILIFVSFIASGYPSIIMVKLKTVEILKGKISIKKPGIFRNSLIVVQFAIAIVLMCTTIIIYQQYRHMRNASLGYNTEALISVPIKHSENGKELVSKMRTLLSGQTSIVSISGSTVNFGVGQDGNTRRMSFGFGYKDKSVTTNFIQADYDILKTLGIPLIAGRDFTTSYVADSLNTVIVTESMAKQLGEKDVVGSSFYADSSQPRWTIVGVIPDFHLYSMHEETAPLTISMTNNKSISYILIRVNSQNPAATMALVKNAYAQVSPGTEFKGSFVDENIERWYKNESRLTKMFTTASLVAIILSCMGLFGMASVIIRQRIKEIGVRKVLGASVKGIVMLVIREFIWPVAVALVIATPVAWWAMETWLHDFVYRIQIQWWFFVVAGSTSILIAVITVSYQAVKAAIANPVKSLRTE